MRAAQRLAVIASVTLVVLGVSTAVASADTPNTTLSWSNNSNVATTSCGYASGNNVVAVQEILRLYGYYNGSIDNYDGPATNAAIIRYQQDKGLTADGCVGPVTWNFFQNSPHFGSGTYTNHPNILYYIPPSGYGSNAFDRTLYYVCAFAANPIAGGEASPVVHGDYYEMWSAGDALYTLNPTGRPGCSSPSHN